jgi:hypothetical protein
LAEGTIVDHPAAFIQQSVMGSERPTDDTVLLVVQRSPQPVASAPEKVWPVSVWRS